MRQCQYNMGMVTKQKKKYLEITIDYEHRTPSTEQQILNEMFQIYYFFFGVFFLQFSYFLFEKKI